MSVQQGEDRRPIGLDEVQEILPWYLTGRTTRAETQAIDDLLKESAELRTQLESVREQRRAIVDSSNEVGDPSAGALQRLLQQIETTKQRRLVPDEEPGWFQRIFGVRRGVLQFALATACAVIVVQGALLYRPVTEPPAEIPFATASISNLPIAETVGPELLVAFRPEVTAAQFGQILSELDATVVDGPKPGMTFVLRLKPTQNAEEAIARLQSRPDLVATAQRR